MRRFLGARNRIFRGMDAEKSLVDRPFGMPGGENAL